MPVSPFTATGRDAPRLTIGDLARRTGFHESALRRGRRRDAPGPATQRTTDTVNDIDKRATTPSGFASTAADVLEGVGLTGTTALVTGANAGIGFETARALAAGAAESTWAGRYRNMSLTSLT